MKRAFLAVVLLSACSVSNDRTPLSNSAGKDDSIAIRMKLTDSNPVVGFTVGCDQPHGCAGHIGVVLKTPEPCALFPDEHRCGISATTPLARDVLTTSITSSTEGPRTLPLKVESGDGTVFKLEIAAAFTAVGNEDVEVTLEKTAGTPDLTIEVRAEWMAKPDPDAEVNELTTFLGTVPGLTFSEVGTKYPGYRAFMLSYEQPIDHKNPAAGTFKQQIALHHRLKASPMILYTSGYSLFSQDLLSELGEGLQANHISTEQRWFGSSRPTDVTPESWRNVNIEQAANDHHRIVQALKPFYSGAWLSTGHSKGGMTSIFHRRFFPDDVAATVAYVAPISYAYPDPRYTMFLDTIGEEACRTAIRTVQKKALEQFDVLFELAKTEATGYTFERSGGHASAFEKSIVMLEWGFWQYRTASECQEFLQAPTDVNGLYQLIRNYAGIGTPDSSIEDYSMPYYYQASQQLGMQQFATAHLPGLLKYEALTVNRLPTGTTPNHSRAAMDDVQQWVKTQGQKMLFLYGQSDPWTGGQYEIGTQAEVVKVVAPSMPHRARLKDLASADRDIALKKIEQWIGSRPTLTPSPTPTPMPSMF